MNITKETNKTVWVFMRYLGESVKKKNYLFKGTDRLQNLTMLSCLTKPQEGHAMFPSDGVVLDVHST